MKRQLLLGCGNSRVKHLGLEGDAEWGDLVTLDVDLSCKPDVVHDLNYFPYPFSDAEFDEIFAFEVLEHVGTQGDWRFFFRQFSELHRILKDGGRIFLTVPSMQSMWLWGDPGHTRALPEGAFHFLSQKHYAQVGSTSCTDYRSIWKGNLVIEGKQDTEASLALVLRKVPV